LNNTGHNTSFSVARLMKIDTRLFCGTGDIGVQRSGRFTHGSDKRKGAHKLLPMSIISFNSAEDIEGGCARETVLMKPPSTASSLKRKSRASSAQVERAGVFHPSALFFGRSRPNLATVFEDEVGLRRMRCASCHVMPPI